MNNIFHKGELEVQKRTGEYLIASSVGKIISDSLPNGAINFLEKQSIAIVNTIDAENNVWVSLLIGDVGFVKILDTDTICFDKKIMYSSNVDILYKNLEKDDCTIGILFIELATRRRLRINGNVTLNNDEIIVKIKESYPNCPKYIQQRAISNLKRHQSTKIEIKHGSKLNKVLQEWIAASDTFFIGSKSDDNKLDASHRGGNKGFIEIKGNMLKIPDYKGNSLYNTLGNIHQNSKTGLLFIDFNKGSILQLTGTSKITFDQNSKEDMLKTGGTGRYVVFTLKRWITTINHHRADWEFLTNSPFNP